MQVDILLSSGFLAFASHLGFLTAIEECGIQPAAMLGTSSGALVGSLFAAGVSTSRIGAILTASRPIALLRPRWRMWDGAFSAEPLLSMLRRELPTTFEELRFPFAVGVARVGDGTHELVTRGPLPEAVLASCAVPRLLSPVQLAQHQYVDGGAVDRTGLRSWRQWRPHRTAVLHRVERSMGRDLTCNSDGVTEVTSPRARNSLWKLRDFDDEMERTRVRTCLTLVRQGLVLDRAT